MDSCQDLSESSIQTTRSPPQVLEECASDLLSPWIPAVGPRGGVPPLRGSLPRRRPLSFRDAEANDHKIHIVRYERMENLVRLAVRLQGTPGGLTLDDIGADFSVSRRTAERMRDAVGAVFGHLDLVDTDDTKRRWRLRSDVVRRLAGVSPDELTELESAAEALERAGIDERADTFRELATKLRTMLRPESRERLESDFEGSCRRRALPCARAQGPGSTRVCSPPCAKRSRRAGGWIPVPRAGDGAAKPEACPAPGAPLRKPRVPRRVERMEGGAAALAPCQHERASHQRRDLRAGPGHRPGALREASVRNLQGGARRGRPPVRSRRRRGCLELRLPPLAVLAVLQSFGVDRLVLVPRAAIGRSRTAGEMRPNPAAPPDRKCQRLVVPFRHRLAPGYYHRNELNYN